MSELKKSVVKSVQGDGMFNDLYKFDVSMEDGTNGKMYKKGDNPYIKTGEEVMYAINSKGTIKIIPKGAENNSFTPKNNNFSSSKSHEDKEDLIMIQTMFKASAEFHSNRTNSTDEDVSRTAEIWYETARLIVCKKCDDKCEEKPVIEKTPVVKDDLPF